MLKTSAEGIYEWDTNPYEYVDDEGNVNFDDYHQNMYKQDLAALKLWFSENRISFPKIFRVKIDNTQMLVTFYTYKLDRGGLTQVDPENCDKPWENPPFTVPFHVPFSHSYLLLV